MIYASWGHSPVPTRPVGTNEDPSAVQRFGIQTGWVRSSASPRTQGVRGLFAPPWMPNLCLSFSPCLKKKKLLPSKMLWCRNIGVAVFWPREACGVFHKPMWPVRCSSGNAFSECFLCFRPLWSSQCWFLSIACLHNKHQIRLTAIESLLCTRDLAFWMLHKQKLLQIRGGWKNSKGEIWRKIPHKAFCSACNL